MREVVQIILIRESDQALVLQQRDNDPRITNPGMTTPFGGTKEPGEDIREAAVRELEEETGIVQEAGDLEYFCTRTKTMAKHGEDSTVYYFLAKWTGKQAIRINEGTGYAVIHDRGDLGHLYTSPLARVVLNDFFDARDQQRIQVDTADAPTAGLDHQAMYSPARHGSKQAG